MSHPPRQAWSRSHIQASLSEAAVVSKPHSHRASAWPLAKRTTLFKIPSMVPPKPGTPERHAPTAGTARPVAPMWPSVRRELTASRAHRVREVSRTAMTAHHYPARISTAGQVNETGNDLARKRRRVNGLPSRRGRPESYGAAQGLVHTAVVPHWLHRGKRARLGLSRVMRLHAGCDADAQQTDRPNISVNGA